MASRKDTTSFVQLDFSFTEPEIWRPVVGYEGYYEVSNLGRVRSLDRVIPHNVWPEKLYHQRGRILQLISKGSGRNVLYRKVQLSVNGQIKQKPVHQMVLEAFVGPCPEGHVVNHLDSDPVNNRLSNLEYVTYARNTQHSIAKGRFKVRGEDNGHSRFTTEEVLLMRRLFKQGMSQSAIARQFKTGTTSVFNIIRRNTWAHVPEEE